MGNPRLSALGLDTLEIARGCPRASAHARERAAMTVGRAQRLAALEPHIDAYVKAYRRRHSTFRQRLAEVWRRSLLGGFGCPLRNRRAAPQENIP